MTSNGYPTPTSTRTYNDGAQKAAKQYFDIDRIIQNIQPNTEELEKVMRCAVSISAYKALPGRESPFPSPFDFFDIGIGKDTPAFERNLSYRSNWLLRLASKMNGYIKDQISSVPHDTVKVRCPECNKETINVTVGTLPIVDVASWTLMPHDEPRMVALTLDCYCQNLTIHDYSTIENEAISKYCKQS